MGKDIQKEMRKQVFDQIEADLQKSCKPEERMFALHPDEEHIYCLARFVLDDEQAFSDQIAKFERILLAA